MKVIIVLCIGCHLFLCFIFQFKELILKKILIFNPLKYYDAQFSLSKT